MQNIFGMTIEDISDILKNKNIPLFRGKQILFWLYQKGVRDFFAMHNLPKSLQKELDTHFSIERETLIEEYTSLDGATTKSLLKFTDGNKVETVLMRKPYGNSVCISTQAGCAMACAFCASTVNGLARNLTAGEMLSEVMFMEEKLRLANQHVTNLVLMGSGEPLANMQEVLKFLCLIHEPYTLNIGYRNITLSTSGIVPHIYSLAREKIPITLSLSLHATDDDLRSKLMPINKKYPLREVIKACDFYSKITKRRVTYEYILLSGVNDSEDDAKKLSTLLKGKLANVNLIPFNPVRERDFKRPNKKRIKNFYELLTKFHITATIRKEMGTEINAACGQLRNAHMRK